MLSGVLCNNVIAEWAGEKPCETEVGKAIGCRDFGDRTRRGGDGKWLASSSGYRGKGEVKVWDSMQWHKKSDAK